ncbi:MAG TPA: D-glycero-beta-D-manno-heptose 1-phosphate adenylyltransferase [Caulobacteraceae bacterium]|nr:D-glycero-beta-D-manno-heptose 1-phosphate adenylyltransferase [Caulobacteraceae bacterium]
MDLSTLQPLLSAIHGARVVCVGDLMIDRYVYGSVGRVSPEAPIPVLLRGSEQAMLGGVGNVARNVAGLGGRSVLVGVIGDDAQGREAKALVDQTPELEGRLVVEGARATTVKTRFVAAGQQLLRLDAEHSGAVDAATEAGLAEAIAQAAEGAGAILLSDYAKGAVTPAVIEACLRAARANGAKLIVDAKARSLAKYGAVDLIKPNALELHALTGLPTETDEEIEAALAQVLADCTAQAILVTRGAMGMSLAERGKPVRHVRGVPRRVFDVSGAGDTGLAALGLALAGHADIADAVAFAVLASGVAVTKIGTAMVTPSELIAAEQAAGLPRAESKIAHLPLVIDQAQQWRAQGLRVGFTNGCFDILHRGHVAYLAQARGWCDRLIVGLNSDRSVRALKGEGRPVNDQDSRALVLAGLSSVDLLTVFDEDTPIDLIKAVRPDVLVKGADYSPATVVGADFVASYGGQVRLANLVDGFSTTAAIARMTSSGKTPA